MMQEGWKLSGSQDHLSISKGDATITFDIVIRTHSGRLFCVNIQRTNEIIGINIDISKDKACKLLGHAGEQSTLQSARAL